MDLATLQRQHPQWNIVDWKVAPNGGIWALGKDGGIFALDATGGTTGVTAPYLGAYTAEAATVRNDPNRTFTRLDLNQNGGYTAVSMNQEHYNYIAPSTATTPTAAPPVDKTGTTQATDTSPGANNASNVSGSGALHAILDPLGLGGLADQALQALHSTPGADSSYISTVWLPQQDAYKKAFPEIAAAQAKLATSPPGTVHIPTPADIVNYRQTAQTMAQQGLIPPEFVTQDKISQLINGGVSVDEFQRRVLTAVDALNNADPAEKAAFMAYHPAVDFSHAVGALLDPTLNEQAVNRAVQQAAIGGNALRSGFGNISAEQATALGQAGAGTQAQFTQAALQNPLTQNLVGESDSVTKGTQLAAMEGDATAQQAITDRQRRRAAAFQGGGGAAAGGAGTQGLGGAQ